MQLIEICLDGIDRPVAYVFGQVWFEKLGGKIEHRTGGSRAYSKRAVQPICAVQDAICAVQNEKLCSPKTQS